MHRRAIGDTPKIKTVRTAPRYNETPSPTGRLDPVVPRSALLPKWISYSTYALKTMPVPIKNAIRRRIDLSVTLFEVNVSVDSEAKGLADSCRDSDFVLNSRRLSGMRERPAPHASVDLRVSRGSALSYAGCLLSSRRSNGGPEPEHIGQRRVRLHVAPAETVKGDRR